MKRIIKIFIIGLLCCMIAAGCMINTSAVCIERSVYVVCPDGNCHPAVRDCEAQDCTGLYQLLRNLGLSETQCNTICEKAGIWCQNGCEKATESDQEAESTETSAEIPTQAPTQLPAQIPAQTPAEPPIQIPAQKPIEVPTQAPAEAQTENAPAAVETLSTYEQEVVRLVNEIRAQYGLSALSADAELSRAARIKSQDMRDNGYFSHNSPTYGTPFEMMQSFGISYRTAGENIAMGYRTPQSVVDGWMNSEGHRKNILNASFTKIGVGYIESGNYWTQMFIG